MRLPKGKGRGQERGHGERIDAGLHLLLRLTETVSCLNRRKMILCSTWMKRSAV